MVKVPRAEFASMDPGRLHLEILKEGGALQGRVMLFTMALLVHAAFVRAFGALVLNSARAVSSEKIRAQLSSDVAACARLYVLCMTLFFSIFRSQAWAEVSKKASNPPSPPPQPSVHSQKPSPRPSNFCPEPEIRGTHCHTTLAAAWQAASDQHSWESDSRIPIRQADLISDGQQGEWTAISTPPPVEGVFARRKGSPLDEDPIFTAQEISFVPQGSKERREAFVTALIEPLAGGSSAAKYLGDHLVQAVTCALEAGLKTEEETSDALKREIAALHQSYIRESQGESGAVYAITIVYKGQIWTVSAGNARAILAGQERSFQLNPVAEVRRTEYAQFLREWREAPMSNHTLPSGMKVASAFGARDRFVSFVPEITVSPCPPEGRLILGSSTLFEGFSSREVAACALQGDLRGAAATLLHTVVQATPRGTVPPTTACLVLSTRGFTDWEFLSNPGTPGGEPHVVSSPSPSRFDLVGSDGEAQSEPASPPHFVESTGWSSERGSEPDLAARVPPQDEARSPSSSHRSSTPTLASLNAALLARELGVPAASPASEAGSHVSGFDEAHSDEEPPPALPAHQPPQPPLTLADLLREASGSVLPPVDPLASPAVVRALGSEGSGLDWAEVNSNGEEEVE